MRRAMCVLAVLTLMAFTLTLCGCGGHSSGPADQTAVKPPKPPPDPGGARYTLVEMDDLIGMSGGTASGINSLGQIVGSVGDTPHGQAYIVEVGDAVTWLAPPPDTDTVTYLGSSALRITDDGKVAGVVTIEDASQPGGWGYHAATWIGGVCTDLGTIAGWINTAAFDINGSGDVTGYGEDSSGRSHPMACSAAGAMVALDEGGAPGGLGHAINDAGTIVGELWSHAASWAGASGPARLLEELPDTYTSYAYDISAEGTALGYCNVPDYKSTRATLWLPPAIDQTIPGTKVKPNTWGYGISDDGLQVVGQMGAYKGGQWQKTPFVWSEARSTEALADLVETTLPMESAYPKDVSNNGMIIGGVPGTAFVLVPN